MRSLRGEPVDFGDMTSTSHDVAPGWKSQHWNPNSSSVLGARAAQLERAHRPLIKDRTAYLVKLADGMAVLDVGVVEHGIASEEGTRWLHAHLRRVARSCIGLDILETDVGALVERGYDVRVHDLASKPFDGRFDLVVAGEIIEHLGNPEGFLRNAAAALLPGGRLVVTTPNPYQVHRAVKFFRGEFPDSVDHVTSFTASNMAELASRAGLSIDVWRGVKLPDLRGVKNRVASLLRRLAVATGAAPEIAAETLIFELVSDQG